MNKREFLKYGLICAGALSGGILNLQLFGSSKKNDFEKESEFQSKEALFYSPSVRGVKCELCPNGCSLRKNEKGLCKVRVNRDGKLYTLAYGNPCSVHIDPIERKPLFHFLPSSQSFSLSTAGCNLSCLNCQNWTTSQVSPEETQNMDLSPDEVVAKSLAKGCKSISYTYTEPVVFYEYVLDIARKSREKKLKNVFISNGFINEKPLKNLIPYLDAANINLKSFSNEVYQKLNGGSLEPVLNTLKILKSEGVWLEITNLIIPTWTDNLEMIKKMCEWLVKNNFQDSPLHFSRFFPMYKLTNLPSTSISVLEKAREIAEKSGMRYIYIGNVPAHPNQNTFCPKCKEIIIERRGFVVVNNYVENGKCKFCKEQISGIWN